MLYKYPRSLLACYRGLPSADWGGGGAGYMRSDGGCYKRNRERNFFFASLPTLRPPGTDWGYISLTADKLREFDTKSLPRGGLLGLSQKKVGKLKIKVTFSIHVWGGILRQTSKPSRRGRWGIVILVLNASSTLHPAILCLQFDIALLIQSSHKKNRL